VVKTRNELGAVAVGEEADIVLQQLREHLALIVGDDAVGDAGERERRPVVAIALTYLKIAAGRQREPEDARRFLWT